MNQPSQFIVPTLVASTFPPLLVAMLILALDNGNSVLGISFITWVVCLFYIAVLGLPIFLWLKFKNKLSWFSLSLAGFITAALPEALLFWPRNTPELAFSTSGIFGAIVVNGVTTINGWLLFLATCFMFGLFGLGSALIFWRVWAYVRSNDALPRFDAFDKHRPMQKLN